MIRIAKDIKNSKSKIVQNIDLFALMYVIPLAGAIFIPPQGGIVLKFKELFAILFLFCACMLSIFSTYYTFSFIRRNGKRFIFWLRQILYLGLLWLLPCAWLNFLFVMRPPFFNRLAFLFDGLALGFFGLYVAILVLSLILPNQKTSNE